MGIAKKREPLDAEPEDPDDKAHSACAQRFDGVGEGAVRASEDTHQMEARPDPFKNPSLTEPPDTLEIPGALPRSSTLTVRASLDAASLERIVAAYPRAITTVHPSLVSGLGLVRHHRPSLPACAGRVTAFVSDGFDPLELDISFLLVHTHFLLVNLPQTGRFPSHAVFQAAQLEGDPAVAVHVGLHKPERT